MTQEENSEKLLTHSEVKKVLESTLQKPNVIYTGPEEDQGLRSSYPSETSLNEDGEEEEEDPLKHLSFEKRSTMEHVDIFNRISEKQAVGMIEKLQEIDRVSETHAFKIAELMPRDETELRPVFAKDRFTLEPEELKRILEIIEEHSDKKNGS